MTLTRNAPVGTLAYHLHDTFTAPRGDPLYLGARFNGGILEGIDRAEPLRCGAEDYRVLASPAVRIGVYDLFACKERTRFLHVGKYRLIGFFIIHTRIFSRVGCLIAAVVNRYYYIDIVLFAGVEVIGTKAGSSVNASRTAVHCDIICINDHGIAVEEGMAGVHIFKFTSGHCSDDLVAFDSACRHCFGCEGFGYDIVIAVGGTENGVTFVGMESNGKVARESPCRCRPYDEICAVKVADGRKLAALVIAYLELYIDRCAFVILIFDLGFGKCRFVVGAPVNGLETLVDVAFFEHLAENAHLACLK